jgi:tetratricopeptide (TPR) repeat protein
LAINPKYANALASKGSSLTNQGNYTGSIQYLDKALAIDPNYVGVLNNIGVTLAKLVETNPKPVAYSQDEIYNIIQSMY